MAEDIFQKYGIEPEKSEPSNPYGIDFESAGGLNVLGGDLQSKVSDYEKRQQQDLIKPPQAGFAGLFSRNTWELAKGAARGLANAAEGVGGLFQKGGEAIADVFQSPEQEVRADQVMNQANQAGKEAISSATAPKEGYDWANKVGEFLGEQAPLLAASAGVGTIARGLAAKGGQFAAKAIPALSKLSGAGKVAAGAAEGVGFMAGSEWMQGKPLGKDDVTTGALIGAAIPLIGIAGEGMKKFFGKYLPESLVKSATRLKPNQKIKIAEKLEQMDELETVKTAEQWLLKNKITGSPDEISEKLLKMSKDARAEKLKILADLPNKFKDPKLKQFADDTAKLLEGASGMEDTLAKVQGTLEALSKKGKGATLGQLDQLKTLFDDSTNIFTTMGSVKESVRAKGLANLRGYAKRFIEDQATKLGVKSIKELNQSVALSRIIGDAVRSQSVGAGGNALASLADRVTGLGVAGVSAGSIGYGINQQDDFPTRLAKAVGIGLGTVLLGKAFSPERKIKLANLLSSKLSQGEAGAILKFMQGDRSVLTPKLKEKVNNLIGEAIVQ